MSSIVWLALAAVFVVAVVLTRTTPKGGKQVVNTRLMGAARHALVVGVIVCGALGILGVFRR